MGYGKGNAYHHNKHTMKITFRIFTEHDIPLFKQWAQLPHVKDVWFIDGYHPLEYFTQKLANNTYDFPFLILLDQQPIGYIQACDLYAYRLFAVKPAGVFTNEAPGTFCMDLFIGDERLLNRGYGTMIVKQFIEKLTTEFKATKILIDPSVDNKRAIRCYEKAGFNAVRIEFDGMTDVQIMEKMIIEP